MSKNSKQRASRGNYETARTLLRLAVFLQGSARGRTIKEIQAHLTCSRATANRWLEALRDTPELRPRSLKPQDGDNPTQYRWVLDKRHLPVTVSPEPADIAALDKMIGELTSKRQRNQLIQLKSKLEAIANEQRREVKEVSAIDQMAYRGVLVRTGLQYELDEKWLQVIERAVAKSSALRISVGYVGDPKSVASFIVYPIGVLAGHFSQLVAGAPGQEIEIRTYRFEMITNIEILSERFDSSQFPTIEEFSRQSFGANHFLSAHDVILEFRGITAEKIGRYRFHPDQEISTLADENFGEVVRVSFRSKGMLELSQELFRWGRAVRVISPQELIEFWKFGLTLSNSAVEFSGIAGRLLEIEKLPVLRGEIGEFEGVGSLERLKTFIQPQAIRQKD